MCFLWDLGKVRFGDLLMLQVHFLIEQILIGEESVKDSLDVGHSFHGHFHLEVLIFECLLLFLNCLEFLFKFLQFLLMLLYICLVVWDISIERVLFICELSEFMFKFLFLGFELSVPIGLEIIDTWSYIRSFWIFINAAIIRPTVFGWWLEWGFMWASPWSFTVDLSGPLNKAWTAACSFTLSPLISSIFSRSSFIAPLMYRSRLPFVTYKFTYACFIRSDKYWISYPLSVGIYWRYWIRRISFTYFKSGSIDYLCPFSYPYSALF